MDNFSENTLRKLSPQWRYEMQTILHGMFFVLISLIFLPASAFACSFALQYGGKMERDSTELSNADRLKLADLLATVRDSAAKEGVVVIYGFADERERNASEVARARARSVSEYLQSLDVASSRINVDTKIWRIDSQIPSVERNQIEVEFEPICTSNGCESPCGVAEPKK